MLTAYIVSLILLFFKQNVYFPPHESKFTPHAINSSRDPAGLRWGLDTHSVEAPTSFQGCPWASQWLQRF